MASPPWLEEVRQRLVKHSLPPTYIRGFIAELTDHFHDLTEENMNTEVDVSSRLGEPAQVADAAVAVYRQRRFLGRHPILVFGVSPVLALIVLFVAWCLGLELLFGACKLLGLDITKTTEYVNHLGTIGSRCGVISCHC